MKKIISLLLLLFLLFGLNFIYINKLNTDSKEVKITLVNEEIKEIEGSDLDDSIEESSEDITSNIDILDNDNDSSNTNYLESNTVSESNELKENKPITEKPANQKEKPMEQTAWDDLGISESDYYNKPMWSWATVDFSITEYITYEETHQACINYGNALEDIVSFSCYTVNSYSGAYLGDMLKIVK